MPLEFPEDALPNATLPDRAPPMSPVRIRISMACSVAGSCFFEFVFGPLSFRFYLPAETPSFDFGSHVSIHPRDRRVGAR
jgi:hypothetical protein